MSEKKKSKFNSYQDVLDEIEKRRGYLSVDTSDVNADYIKSFMADSQKYFNDAQGIYDAINWGNASATYDERNAAWQALSERANKVGAYYYKNRNKYSNYDDIVSMLDELSSGGTGILDQFKNARNQYTQYQTEEDYKRAVAEAEAYNTTINSKDFAPLVEKGKANEKTLWEQDLQKLLTTSEYDKYTNPFEVAKDQWNNLTQGDWEEYIKTGIIGGLYSTFPEVAKPLEMFMKGLDIKDFADKWIIDGLRIDEQLSDAEKNMYYYYLGKEDYDTAQAYFDKLAEVAKSRKAENYALKYNDTFWELPMSWGAGVDSFVTGFDTAMSKLGNVVYDRESATYDPTTLQYAQGMMSSEKLVFNEETGKYETLWDANEGLWKVANDLAYTIGNQLPTIALNVATGGVAGAIPMGISAAGNAYSEMKKVKGVEDWQAMLYGISIGTLEGVLSKVLGGISGLGADGGLAQKAIQKALPNITSALGKFALTASAKVLDEGIEEALQEVFDPIVQGIITGQISDDQDTIYEVLVNAAYSGALGALSAGALEVTRSGVKTIKNLNTTKNTYSGISSELVNDILSKNPNDAFALKMQDKLGKGKKLSGGNLAALVERGDRTAIESAITQKLTERGERGDVTKLSQALAKEAMGYGLSKAEANLIQSSDFGRSIQAELNPDNLSSNAEMDRWAEKIGTREVNPKQYNKQVEVKTIKEDGKVELESGKIVDAKSVSFANESDDLIFKIATQRVSRVDGWTNETANAMVKGYDGKVTATAYRKAYISAFEMGKNGEQASQIVELANQTGIKGSTLLAAYDMGMQATEKALTNSTEGGKIESEVKTDESTGLRLRDSSKRNGSKDSQKQVSGVEESTGRDTSREDTERKVADSEAVKLADEGRKVKVSELGILNGSKTQTVTVVDKSQETSEMKKARKEAEKRGLKVRFFLGDNLVIEENGELISVRGYIKGEYVFVRADHPLYTSYQLMRHEIGHDMIAKGEIDINKVRAKLKEIVGEENIDLVADMYAEAYERSGLDADALWEECICDSLGDMNVFSKFADIDQGIITMMLGDIKQATEDTKTAPNKTRGAPEGKASRETSGYKKQDYERYGWAREAGIVSFNNMSDLESKLKTKKSLKDFQQSMRGEAIVAVNEHPNSTLEVNNTLLYVVGSRNFPKITKVIKINLYNETDIELVERSIYESEQQSWSRASSFMANLFEAELVREYSPKDFPNYQEYKTKSKQPSGGLESQRDNGNNQPFSKRTGDNSKNKGKFSRELDTAYLSAVERGDMETAQRFNEENEDIRYSRDLDIEGDSAVETKPLSNRELLANALLDTVQHEVEYTKLMEYKSVIDKLEAKDIELAKLKNQIREATFGNGDKTKLKELKEKARKTEASINFYDKKLLQLESTQALKNVLERAKKKAYSKALAKGRETLHANVEGRHKTIERNRIKDIAHDLDKLLNKGTKKRNVKIGAQPIVSALLDITDRLLATDDELIMSGIVTETNSVEEDALGKYRELYNELHSTDDDVTNHKEKRKEIRSKMHEVKKDLVDLLERERKRINKAKAKDSMTALIDEYAKLKNANEGYLNLAYKQEVYDHLVTLRDNLKEKLVSEMTLDDLKSLHKACTMIQKMVTDSNKIFREGKTEDIKDRASSILGDVNKLSKREQDALAAFGNLAEGVESFNWKNLRPVDVFTIIGSPKLKELFWDVINAQDKYGANANKITKDIVEFRKKYGYKKWDTNKVMTIKTVDGDFRVTLGELMSIYAYSKREQADLHMSEGGFQHQDKAFYKDDKGLYRKRAKAEHPYRIGQLQRPKIISMLTKEQREYVDALVDYITKYGEKGNEVSRTLYGIDLFTETHYFPLKSSHDFLASTQTQIGQTQTTSSLSNIGMSKPTTPNANNPIILQSFDDVILEHLDSMSKYNAYVIPIENLRKVLDFVDRDSNKSLKTIIGSRLGVGATNYLEQYITDLNGGKSAESGTLAKMFGKGKAASVMMNLSVWAQQYFSIIRAMSKVNPKYFIPFLGEKFKNPSMKLYEEMKTYAPITTIKEMGGFDVGSNRALKEYVGLEETKFNKNVLAKKANDIFGFGANLMDKAGWMTIWSAIKKEVAHEQGFKEGSDAYFDACRRRMNEVITETQVYDSVNARSGMMRSKSELDKFATSFMGEPTVIVGMAETSVVKLKRAIASKDADAIKEALGDFAGVAASIVLSIAMGELVKSAIYAMRDDDEDETFAEKYATALGSAMANDINPMNYIPYARDISSLIDGWTVDRPDMQLIEDFVNASKKLLVYNEGDNLAEEGLSAALSFANLLGLPLKNALRDFKAMINLVKTLSRNYKSSTEGLLLKGAASGSWVLQTLLDDKGTLSKSEKLYRAMVDGDVSRLDYFKSTYEDEKSYNSALRKSLRDNDPRVEQAALARLNRDNDTYYNLMMDIIDEGIFDRKMVKEAFEAEYNYQKRLKEEAEK